LKVFLIQVRDFGKCYAHAKARITGFNHTLHSESDAANLNGEMHCCARCRSCSHFNVASAEADVGQLGKSPNSTVLRHKFNIALTPVASIVPFFTVFSSNRGGLWRLWRISVLGGAPATAGRWGKDAYEPTVSTPVISAKRGSWLADTQEMILWRHGVCCGTSSFQFALSGLLLFGLRMDLHYRASHQARTQKCGGRCFNC
jgi:hypothetical protein